MGANAWGAAVVSDRSAGDRVAARGKTTARADVSGRSVVRRDLPPQERGLPADLLRGAVDDPALAYTAADRSILVAMEGRSKGGSNPEPRRPGSGVAQ